MQARAWIFDGRLKIAVLGLWVALAWAGPGWAGDASLQSDGSVTWQAGVDGVEVEWNPDGTMRRAYSRYGTPVEFGDRRGIKKAQIIAEEKAKAAIVRFMKQAVVSSRIVTEIQNDLNKATQTRETNSPANVKKVDERMLIENLTEVTGSFAAGTLAGVKILESGYDDKAEEAWVVVGISERTIGAARGLERMNADQRPGSAASGGPGAAGAGSIKTQPNEVRRSTQKNW